jgi:hypothetical protein
MVCCVVVFVVVGGGGGGEEANRTYIGAERDSQYQYQYHTRILCGRS